MLCQSCCGSTVNITPATMPPVPCWRSFTTWYVARYAPPLSHPQIGDSVNANKHIERAMEETSQFTEHYRGIHCVINADFEQAHHQFTVCKNSYEAQETSTVVNSCENTTINNIAVSLFYMSRTVAAKNAIDSCLNIYKVSTNGILESPTTAVWCQPLLK